MKPRSGLQQTLSFCTAILMGALLLSLPPTYGSPAAASIAGDAVASKPQPLGAESRAGVETWTRTLDPVIIPGSRLALFQGVTLGDLFVYAYESGTWTAVPFQFDEVDPAGAFVTVEDGLLDSNDQLVFMAADLGAMVAPHQWLADASSRSYSRYEMRITNPLNPAEEGWVYVYRSTTLAPMFPPYVTWDGASNIMVAGTYIIGYAPTVHLGIDSLYLNGHPTDVMDQSKFRLSGACYVDEEWEEFSLTEESEEVRNQFEPPAILGAVRVGGGTITSQSWAYASMFEHRSEFRAGEVDPQCDDIRYDLFRVSDDWRNPAQIGMAPMTYYDSNTAAGVPIDGAFDSVASAPLATWRQISGAYGTVVAVLDIGAWGYAGTNYYKDLLDTDPEDTGDQKSFGDAGFRLVSPSHNVPILAVNYVLEPNLPNVGATFRQYYDNPIEAAATVQDFYDCSPSDVSISWRPRPVYRGSETTFTALIGGGAEPFTYTWSFGGDGSAVAGNPVTHTFPLTGAIPVTLTVSNECGSAAPVANQVMVWEPGTPLYLVYLPILLRQGP